MRRVRNRAGRPLWLASVFAAAVAMFWASGLMSADADATAEPSPPTALVGALIRTQTDAGDFVGNIIIKDKQIVAMGPDVAVPADAKRIDVANCVITPGLIDVRSVLWLNSGTARESGRDASLNIIDGIDVYSDDWRDVARQGVTAVYVQPSHTGSLGGAGAVLRVGPAVTSEELVVRHPAGVQAMLGSATAAATPQANPLADILARFGITPPAAPAAQAPAGSNSLTRYAQYESLRGQFDAAKRTGEGKASTKDAGKELLTKALKKEVPVRLEVNHEDDVRNSLKLADLGLRVIYERLDHVKTLPEELATSGNAIVVGPFVGNKKSAELRKVATDGRKIALGSFGDNPRDSSWLRMHAATAINEGYPRDRMLKAMTHDAAELLGVGDKLGSLASGRMADLVVFAGDPLDPSVPVRMAISQGVVTHDNPKAVNGQSVAKGTAKANESPVDVPTAGFVANHVVTFDESTPDADAGQLRGADGLAPSDKKLADYADNGFSHAVVAPGSSNVLAGVISTVATNNAESQQECGFKFVLTSAARNNERYPNSLVGQVELVRNRMRGKPSSTNLYLPRPISEALMTQRDAHLKQVRDRKMAAYFEVHTRAEILAALALIQEFNLRGVLVQPRQVEDLVDDIRKAGVSVVVGPFRPTDSDKTINGFLALGNAGVPLMLGGGDSNDLRRSAAILVNAGLPRTLARQILTGQAAEQFGLNIGGRGEFVSGTTKGDAIVWDGDPLDPGSKVVNRTAGASAVSAKEPGTNADKNTASQSRD